jgi:hypothetical protein
VRVYVHVRTARHTCFTNTVICRRRGSTNRGWDLSYNCVVVVVVVALFVSLKFGLCWCLSDLLWEKNIIYSLKSTAEVIQANRTGVTRWLVDKCPCFRALNFFGVWDFPIKMSDEIVIRIYAWWTALAQCDQIVVSRMYVFDKWRSVRSVLISWKWKLERETRRKRGGVSISSHPWNSVN